MPEHIATYIRGRESDGYLKNWSILIKSNSVATAPRYTVGGLEVGLLRRRAHSGSNNLALYSTKSLIGSQDEAFDLTESELLEAEQLAADAGRDPSAVASTGRPPPHRTILILYLLDSSNIELPKDRTGDHRIEPGHPFAAYAISFPQVEGDDSVGVDYIVNGAFGD